MCRLLKTGDKLMKDNEKQNTDAPDFYLCCIRNLITHKDHPGGVKAVFVQDERKNLENARTVHGPNTDTAVRKNGVKFNHG